MWREKQEKINTKTNKKTNQKKYLNKKTYNIRKDKDKQIRARQPSKRPKKIGKQRRGREKEGTQMTNSQSPTPAACGPDRQTKKPEFMQKASKSQQI